MLVENSRAILMSFIAVASLVRVVSEKFVFDRYRAINEIMGTFVWEPTGSLRKSLGKAMIFLLVLDGGGLVLMWTSVTLSVNC